VIGRVGDEALALRREKAARVPSDYDPQAERNVVINDGREPDPLAWEQQSGRHDRHPVAGRGEFLETVRVAAFERNVRMDARGLEGTVEDLAAS